MPSNINDCPEQQNRKQTDRFNSELDEKCRQNEINLIIKKRKRSHGTLLKATRKNNAKINICAHQLSEETRIIFGSTTTNLFDAYRNILDQAIVKGVASLPFLPTSQQTIQFSLRNISKAFHKEYEQDLSNNDKKLSDEFENETEGGDDKLLKMLRESFAKNVEKAELYSLRNIFSLNDLPRSKRIQLLNAFENNIDPDILDATINSDIHSDTSQIFSSNEDKEPMIIEQQEHKGIKTKDVKMNLHVPISIHDVPSPDQIQTIEEEMQDIRIDLLKKKRMRNLLAHQLQLMKQPEITVKNVNQSILSSIENINSSSHGETIVNQSDSYRLEKTRNSCKDNLIPRNIKDAVKSVMIQQTQLEQYTQHAHNLKERMNELKEKNENLYGNGDENDDYLNVLLISTSKKKSYESSLDDHFQQMKNRLGLSNSSTSDIQKLLKGLKRKSER